MATKKIIISRTTPFLRAIFSSTSSSTSMPSPRLLFHSRFLSSSELPNNSNNNKTVNPKLVNFSLPDSDSDDNEANSKATTHKPELPPPYDPFRKKPEEDPEDPKDLQAVFHKMRGDGLFDSAVKMFDGLSRDGLTHEALELFGRIKDRSEMPEVVAHTAVVEAYAGAGRPKEALRTFLRMLSCGVAPNAYTYSVLVKGLAPHPEFVGQAKKYVAEMVERGIRPNAGVCVAVIEAMVRYEKTEEGRDLVGLLRERGFVPEEKSVREVLKSKRGPVFRSVMRILFDN